MLFICFVVTAFSQSFNAEVINYESSFTVKNNILSESYYVAIKINNTQGDDYDAITIPYIEDSPVYDIEAWIEDVNGNKIRKLKKQEIIDRSYIGKNNLYDNNRAKFFELKSGSYPYIIEYKYCCNRKEFFSICDWSPIYDEKIPTLNAKLVVTLPVGYKAAFYENKTAPPQKDSTKHEIIRTWQETYLHPLVPEVCTPSFKEELMPFVSVVPIEFDMGVTGSQQDWASLGKWAYNLNKGLDDLPLAEVEKVHELIKGIDKKEDIVKKLYQYLQDNTRYVSVQIGIGGYKSFPASYVAEKKYGDCKALSNYMKALLKAAGISSYLALINGDADEGGYELADKFVSSQFNHVILFVPLEKDTIWLDCTSKTNPCGYLGTFTQGRYALIVDSNNSKLVKTPALVPANCYTLCSNRIHIDTLGNALLTSSTKCKGYGYDRDAAYSALLSKDKQKEYLDAIIPYKDFDINRFNVKKESRDSADIELDYQIVLKNNITQSSSYIFLQLAMPRIPEFENPSERHFPVRLTYPINYMDTTEVSISSKYRIEKNQDNDIENKYGVVKINYILHDNKIEIYRNILINSGEYGIDKYPDFYQFINKLREAVNTPISFKKYE